MNKVTDHNPMQYFQQWFHEVDTFYPEEETNAMQLATIGIDGFPKSRIVLLKKFTWEGFVFFTNFESEKGKSIANHNKVALLFNWSSANREVFISGTAEKIATNLAEGYFESRPKGSQLGAWASKQSTEISSRKVLDEQLEFFENKFENDAIPMPKYWGGYIVKPSKMMFTQKYPTEAFSKITTYTLRPDFIWNKNIHFNTHTNEAH